MNDAISLKAIASSAVLSNGGLVPFAEQVDAFAYGSMPSGDMFVVSLDAAKDGLPEAGDLPILMKQSTVKKIQATHDIPLSQVANIPRWIEEHPLAMDSITEQNSLVVVADALDAHGNDIIIAMHLEKEHRRLFLNEIASVYGKRNLTYLVENTFTLGKNVYTNTRTDEWMQRTGLQLPERLTNRLHRTVYTVNQLWGIYSR